MTKGNSELVKGGSVRASFQCVDAIEISLCIEKEGLLFYESAAKKIQNQKIQKVFSRLADEEREHIQALQEKARFLQPAIMNRTRSKEHVHHFLMEELKGKIFPSSKDSSMQELQNDQQAIELGIDAEKKSIEVLQKLLEKEKKLDVKAIFLHLLVEEKKHLSLLESLKT